MKLGILGCGFSGTEIGRRFIENNIDVWGTTRSADGVDPILKARIRPIVFDGEFVSDEFLGALEQTTHLVVSIAPSREENTAAPDAVVDPVLTAFQNHDLSAIAPQLEWVLYLSTVGVYGNHDGAWIDETAELKPTSPRARQRMRAEAEWIGAGEALNLPISIFRLSGIYGPGRNALLNASLGKSRRLIKKDQVFNRIHVGDIAGAAERAAEINASGIFNITDNEPAPPQDIVTHVHQLLGLELPPEVDFETADLSPMARSFYGENKRVSNAKSKKALGMSYNWADYRVALTRMYEEDGWKG